MKWLLRWFVILALLVYITMLGGCAALRKSGYVGAGAAAGGAAGSLLGPVGAAVGAAAGAITVSATSDAQSFSDGEIVGEGALERELARWKGAAYVAQISANVAEDAADWKAKLFRWGLWAAIAYFLIRNRNYLLKFGPGYLHGLLHSIIGGKHPDAPPIPSDPPEDTRIRRRPS